VNDIIEDIYSIEAQIREIVARKEEGTLNEGDTEVLRQETHVDLFRKLLVKLSAVYKENLKEFPKEIADIKSAEPVTSYPIRYRYFREGPHDSQRARRPREVD
jgi:hypothetical protein